MRSTFKVLFYVKKGSEKPNGNLPLMCRITVDGEIKQFSCKMDVPPRLWDSRAQGTFTRYRTVCNHIRGFLPHTYKREDIPLKELNLTFINDFEYFLRTEKKCRTNTVWGYMIALKHIVSIARNNGRLPFNPFAGYINSPESVDRGYLTQTEIQTLMDAPMKNATHELVRDLFVFSVFTNVALNKINL